MWTVCWKEGNKQTERWERFEEEQEVRIKIEELTLYQYEWHIALDEILILSPTGDETNGYAYLHE